MFCICKDKCARFATEITRGSLGPARCSHSMLPAFPSTAAEVLPAILSLQILHTARYNLEWKYSKTLWLSTCQVDSEILDCRITLD